MCAIDRSPLFPFPRPVSFSLAFARSLAKFIHKSYLQPRYNPYHPFYFKRLRVLRRFDKLRSRFFFSFLCYFRFTKTIISNSFLGYVAIIALVKESIIDLVSFCLSTIKFLSNQAIFDSFMNWLKSNVFFQKKN